MADTPFNIFDAILGPTAAIKAQNNEARILNEKSAAIGGSRGSIAAEIGQMLQANPQASPQELIRGILQSPNLSAAFENDPDALVNAITTAKAGGYTAPEPIKMGEGDTLFQPTPEGMKIIARGSGVDAQGNKIQQPTEKQRNFEFFASQAGVGSDARQQAARRELMGDPSATQEKFNLLTGAGVRSDIAAKIVGGTLEAKPVKNEFGGDIGVQILDLSTGRIMKPTEIMQPSTDPNAPENLVDAQGQTMRPPEMASPYDQQAPVGVNVIDPAQAAAAGFTGASGPAPAVGGNVIEGTAPATLRGAQLPAGPPLAAPAEGVPYEPPVSPAGRPGASIVANPADASSPVARGTRVRQVQGSQARIRRQPIAPALATAFERAAESADVLVDVYSGGQPGRGEGGARTGSTRHDHGGAGDVYLRDPRTKQVLDFRNEQDRPRIVNFIQQSVANGANGIGAGEGYMGKGIHVGFGTRGEQGGPVTVWGAGGKGTNAPAWLRRAVSQATNGKFVDGGARTSEGTAAPGKPLKGVLGDKSEAFLAAGPLGKLAGTAQSIGRLVDPNFKLEGAAGEANVQVDALQQMALSMRLLRNASGDEMNRQEFNQLEKSVSSMFGNWTDAKTGLESAAGVVAEANAMYDHYSQILTGGGQSPDELKAARKALNTLDEFMARWPTQEQIQNQIEGIETGQAQPLTVGRALGAAESAPSRIAPEVEGVLGEAQRALGVEGQTGAQAAAVSPNAIAGMSLQQLEALGGQIASMDQAQIAAFRARLQQLKGGAQRNMQQQLNNVPRTP